MQLPSDLTEKGRETLDQLRFHPTTHHADWDDVIAMLKQIAEVELTHAGAVAVVKIENARIELSRPRSGPLPESAVLKIRRMLKTVGLL